jgi:flavin reductase (DIM6/NTAB) family NADH-FMN oxidoreductase RutF
MSRAASIALDADTLRKAFSCFPSGVTAVCGLVDGEPVGMAASSFTSVSLDPPMVLICVSTTSKTWERLRPLNRLGVSVLSATHDLACRQLAARENERFASLDWSATPGGAVVMGGASAWLECEVELEVDAGDHRVILLRIHTLEADPNVDPLVFHASRFRPLALPSGT